MSEVRWTPGQQNCIDARGGTVLVSAAAGSGKTAVLIERIISLLCDTEHPVDVDRLLVVTFTKAAAAEMRARLSKRLAAKAALDPHNRHILRQQMLLPQAYICTIDSFCAQLLREQAQQAGVSPHFRVAEDTALKLMKNDVARAVINDAYQSGDPAFIKLCDIITGDRGDQKLVEQVLRIYEFIQAHPFPMAWLDAKQRCFEEDCAIEDTVWGQILLEQAREDLQAAAEALTIAVNDMSQDDRVQAAYGTSISLSLSGILQAIDTLGGDWDSICDAVSAIRFDRMKPLYKYEDEAFKAHITSLREHAKTLVEKHVKSYLSRPSALAEADIKKSASLIKVLFDLVRAFTERFSAAKAEQNMLDFGDLEHIALSLLATPNDDGSFTRTSAAVEIGARFSHIMVDEYQDTNATQDTLFSALSDNEQNLFFVGDIKQSIYGFRQAMPSIFRGRRERGTPYNGKDFPASITLGNNFRSRKQVTESVNFFFRLLMGEKTGGIVYDEREELVSSASFEEADNTAYDTELLIIQKKELDEPLSAHQAEARVIGERILQMMADGFCVSDKAGLRRATYRDFCILLRSTSRTAPIFVKELQEMGIPVASGGHDNFFDYAEIRTALSILRTIDNPLLDVPMLATLMSPIFGFSPDDMAMIRAVGRDITLFTALRKLSRAKKHPLYTRANVFLEVLDNYRTLAAAMPADKLIRRLFEDTDMLSVMSAKVGGTQRIANLRRLYDFARHFEQQDFRGLSAFVRYMDKLEANGIALDAASKENDSQNAVHLMTIHRSKGLEFPVVFVAGLASDFNAASVREDILLHADHGIGMTLRDRETLTESDPFHKQAIAAAITRSERTEELRVLYVALTRAKDKLILLSTVEKLASTLERLSTASHHAEGEVLPPSFVLHASRMSDWILAAAMTHDAGETLRDILAGDEPRVCRANGLAIATVSPHNIVIETDDSGRDAEAIALNGAKERLDFVYPYQALGQVAAKITASQTAHNAQDEAPIKLTQPAFLSKGGLTPAQRGTATHVFLEHLDLTSRQTAAEQAGQMVADGILTEAQMQVLALPKIQRFLESDTAKRMAASPMLLREFPFAVERPITTFDIDLGGLPADAADETIMVQGIADAVFEENGELVIVDYKTDRVDRADILADRYRPQLLIYKDALSRALGKPVKECLIYSFHLNDTVSI